MADMFSNMFSPVVRTKVGSRFLISTQSVSLTGTNPEFEIFLDEWSCIVRFLTDEENAKSRYKVNVNQDKLYLDLFNHISTTGELIFNPIKVAKAGRWQIYLTYWTKLHKGSSSGARTMDYSVWLEELKDD
jgi:hypothetical protein